MNTENNLYIEDINSLIDTSISHIENMGKGEINGQTTGLVSLDNQTDGFNAGELIVIGARPAIGKTSFIINTVLANIEKNCGVLYFSLDMHKTQIMLRLMSLKTKIPLYNIRSGNLNQEQAKLLTQEFNNLRDKKLFIDDSKNITIDQLEFKVKKII